MIVLRSIPPNGGSIPRSWGGAEPMIAKVMAAWMKVSSRHIPRRHPSKPRTGLLGPRVCRGPPARGRMRCSADPRNARPKIFYCACKKRGTRVPRNFLPSVLDWVVFKILPGLRRPARRQLAPAAFIPGYFLVVSTALAASARFQFISPRGAHRTLRRLPAWRGNGRRY
jgi:hypothetical protein